MFAFIEKSGQYAHSMQTESKRLLNNSDLPTYWCRLVRNKDGYTCLINLMVLCIVTHFLKPGNKRLSSI